MSRPIILILIIILLSGCSEMRVIGNAAIRELRAEGMSVETISYNYHQKLAAREQATGIMMARADLRGMATDGRRVGSAKAMKSTKVGRVKGLWEKH